MGSPQKRNFCGERSRSGKAELSPVGGSEGCGACGDEGQGSGPSFPQTGGKWTDNFFCAPVFTKKVGKIFAMAGHGDCVDPVNQEFSTASTEFSTTAWKPLRF